MKNAQKKIFLITGAGAGFGRARGRDISTSGSHAPHAAHLRVENQIGKTRAVYQTRSRRCTSLRDLIGKHSVRPGDHTGLTLDLRGALNCP